MKPAISKQAVLKASLLLVLAANVSWEPLKAFHSYDAALEGAAPTRSRAEESAAVNRPEAPRADREQPATPAERTRIESSAVTRKEETRNWCGVRVLIRYEQVPGENKTKGTVIRRFPDDRVLFEHSVSGSFQTNVEDTDNRADFEQYLEQQSRPKLGSSCTTPTPVVAGTLSGGTLSAGTMSAEQRTRLEADVRNCRKNEDGSTIDSASRLECNQERLSQIASFDEDDRKAKREAQSQFNSIVDQIKKDLRKEVKASLITDEDAADARELVDTAIESIQESGQEIGISRQVIQRAVTDIRNMYGAMNKGKELKDFQDRAEQESIDMRSRLDAARSELDMANTSGNPWAMQQANTNMMAVLGQGMTMANVYNRSVDGRIAELRGYERQHWLEASDFTDFTSGIESLRRDLEIYKNGGRMSSTTMPTSLSMPEDLLTYRRGRADNYTSVYGGIPVRPSMNTTVPTNVQIPRATFNTYDPRVPATRIN